MGRDGYRQGSTILVAVPNDEHPARPDSPDGDGTAAPLLAAAGRRDVVGVVLGELPETGHKVAAIADLLRRRFPGASVYRVPVPNPSGPGAAGRTADCLMAECRARLSPGESIAVLLPEGIPALVRSLMQAGADREVPIRFWRETAPGMAAGGEPILEDVLVFEPGSGNPSGNRIREPRSVYGTAATAAGGDPAPDPDPAKTLGLVAAHPAMRQVIGTLTSVGPHSVPVLIQGETGTGKGLCARLLHALGPAPHGPFVAVNCGALPESLIESQLFGHRRGAFTGAIADYQGFFARADGGTLFLDEVGELPVHLQPRLLKVLEDGEVEPLGGAGGTPVDVRIVAATNRDLRTSVADRTFREDLYYRLAFAIVEVPALRDRRSDIPALACQLLDRLNRSLAAPKQLSADALSALEAGHWPGNVRDLENLIGRSALLAPNPVIEVGDLAWDQAPGTEPGTSGRPLFGPGFSLETHLAGERERIIRMALKRTDGNRSEAARLLGVSRQAVVKFLQSRESE